MSIHIVILYENGDTTESSYIVGAFTDYDEAVQVAVLEQRSTNNRYKGAVLTTELGKYIADQYLHQPPTLRFVDDVLEFKPGGN
jgi:hypothetical protein